MTIIRLLTISFIWLIAFQANATAQDYNNNKGEAEFWPDRIFLKLKESAYVKLPNYEQSNADNNRHAADYPVLGPLMNEFAISRVYKPFALIKSPIFENTYEVRFDPSKNAHALINSLKANPIIDYVEQVPIERQCADPNDPKYTDGTLWFMSSIGAPQAWNMANGSANIVIAVVDDAVKTNHEDIASNLWVNTDEIANNGIDDDADGYIDNINGWDTADGDNNPNPPTSATASSFGHGTHCAGIAAGASNNNVGISAVSNNVRLMPIKTTRNSAADPSIIEYGWQGVQCAIASGADIISLSWGSTTYIATYQNLINYAESQGVLVFAAAGNAGSSTPFYPAGYDLVVGVAATASGDLKASYSNYGSWVDISAPGSQIYSAVPPNTNSYGYKSGTSMATPLAASCAALLLSSSPTSTPQQIRNCLFSGADNINALNSSYSGQLGAGRINVYNALTCLNGGSNSTATTCGTPTNVSAASITSTGATVSWGSVTGATSYSLKYRITGASTWTTTTTTTASKTLSGLTAGSSYEVQVSATCSSGSSSYTTSYTFSTTAAATSCGIPTGLATATITSTGVTLTWGTVSGSSNYGLRYRVVGTSTWTTTLTTATTRILSGLVANTTYEFQVKSICGTINGSYSSSVTATTLGGTSTQSIDEGGGDNQNTGCPSMKIAFDYSVESGAAQFVNLSEGTYDTYLWNFGDGTSSIEENPTHIYSDNKGYQFTLTLSNSEDGCNESFSGNLYITDNRPRLAAPSFRP